MNLPMFKMITDRMSMAILFSLIMRVRMNWTRSIAALALLFAAFGFSAMAQDNPDKPFNAEAASALRQELIDGLPDLIEDEAQVTAITEKWEARQDLAGKTREQKLKMLQADVRSVVNDPKLLDGIWKAWTAEVDTDEEELVKTPQEPTTPAMKVPETPLWSLQQNHHPRSRLTRNL